MTGWTCPKCNIGVSPLEKACPKCAPATVGPFVPAPYWPTVPPIYITPQGPNDWTWRIGDVTCGESVTVPQAATWSGTLGAYNGAQS